jgi:hypothetical protein
LDSALDPIHKLVILYLNETKKRGKPYATELARLIVYETKVSAALLDLSERISQHLQRTKDIKSMSLIMIR